MCDKSLSSIAEFKVSVPIRLKMSLFTSAKHVVLNSLFISTGLVSLHIFLYQTSRNNAQSVSVVLGSMTGCFFVFDICIALGAPSIWRAIVYLCSICYMSWAIKSRVLPGVDAMPYFVKIVSHFHQILFTEPCKITTIAMVVVILNYFILAPMRYNYKNTCDPWPHSCLYNTGYGNLCLSVQVPHYLMRPSISTLQLWQQTNKQLYLRLICSSSMDKHIAESFRWFQQGKNFPGFCLAAIISTISCSSKTDYLLAMAPMIAWGSIRSEASNIPI